MHIAYKQFFTDGKGETETSLRYYRTNPVEELNLPPIITSSDTSTVEENADITAVIYDAEATDPDGDIIKNVVGTVVSGLVFVWAGVIIGRLGSG